MITFQNIIIFFIILSIIMTAVVTVYIYIKIRSDKTDINEEKDVLKEDVEKKEEILSEKKDLIEEIDYNKGLLN